MSLDSAVHEKFRELFNEEPLIVRSPGRANLIGEHTDYNLGFILPCAIDKAVYFAISPRSDDHCVFYALDLNERHECETTSLQKSDRRWPNYVMGVLDQFKKAGHKLKGINCVFGGNVPQGAGLSSSAAVEAGLAFAVDHIYHLEIDKFSLVKLAQKAENEFVGVQCGIMDQFINIFGKEGSVVRLDCRSLEFDYFPFDFPDISLVLFNSKVSHSHASSGYNQRRKQCEEGVKVVRKFEKGVKSLRDVSSELLRQYSFTLDPIVYRRCMYVVEENERVLKSCTALQEKNIASFGAFMFQTHDGLSKDYEVSCQEVDYLVELVRENPDVYGSRMMGGGFGGCTINLVRTDAVDELTSEVSQHYHHKYNIECETYVTTISSGTQIISSKTD